MESITALSVERNISPHGGELPSTLHLCGDCSIWRALGLFDDGGFFVIMSKIIKTSPEETMFEVRIKGFKTPEAAEQFAAWFEGQGESDIAYWWDARLDEGIPVGESPTVVVPFEPQCIDGVVTMTVRN